ncbi:MAG: TIGR03000 domain-containing protein [Planctomycetaceae bacterium]|nr:TIGR03000 domain-containing protein [Planctomycetaceae bacterium]
MSIQGSAFAQWNTVGDWNEYSEYVVAYPAYSTYSGVYPACPWRPFGGLFAGVVNGVSRATHFLLCPFCRHYPCSCVVPVIDPCFQSCNTCGEIRSDCGCHHGITRTEYSEYYQPPTSQTTIGTPSSTGFGVAAPITAQPTFAASPSQPLTTQRSLSSNPFSPSNPPRQPLIQPDASVTVPPNIIPESYPTTPPTTSFPTFPERVNSTFETQPVPPNVPPVIPEIDLNSENPPVANPPVESTNPGTTLRFPLDRTTTENNSLPTPVGIPRRNNNDPQPSHGESNRANPLLLDLNSGSISLTVPENAKVFINGYETKIQGTNRTYVVKNLVAGKQYDYNVRIVTTNNGQTIEKNRRLSLIGGRQNAVAYNWFAPTNESVHIAARPVH